MGEYQLYITNEILLEYDEKITEIFSSKTSAYLLGALTLLENVKKIDVYFQLNLIEADVVDNKFVDCAFAGNVNFIVTNDKHYNILRKINFPKINICSLEKFKQYILGNSKTMMFEA